MRALTLSLLAVTAALAGCSSDPCDGKSGTCIAARIEGAIPSLTQLRITVDGLGTKSSPDPAGAAFTLPVKVAIVLPPSEDSPTEITIDALDGARVVGTSGAVLVAFSPGQKQSQTFTLTGGSPPDGGGNDLAGGDMEPPPGQISFNATAFTFPATERGMVSPPQMVRISNRTAMEQTISVTQFDASFGMADEFDVKFDASCNDQASMGVRIAAGANCDGMIAFKPAAGGTRQARIPLTASNGQMFELMFQGQGLRGWSSLNVPGNPQLEAVTGFDNPLELIVAGHDTSGTPIWIYDERDQRWGRDAASGIVTKNIFSLETVDDGTSRRLFAGGDDNTLYVSKDGADFQAITAPFGAGSILRTMAVNQNKTYLYVGTDGGIWARYNLVDVAAGWQGPYSWQGLIKFVPGGQGIEIIGVADAKVSALYNVTDTMPIALSTPPVGGFPRGLTGGWLGADGSNRPRLWVVGAPDTILAWGNTATPYVTESINSTVRNPSAVAGRWNAMANGFDLYMVGAFGPAVLKRGPNGMWNEVAVPGNSGRNGIWVSPSGEVVTIGVNGETTLFY